MEAARAAGNMGDDSRYEPSCRFRAMHSSEVRGESLRLPGRITHPTVLSIRRLRQARRNYELFCSVTFDGCTDGQDVRAASFQKQTHAPLGTRSGTAEQVNLLLTGYLADGAYRNALLRSLSSSSEPKRGPSLLSVYCEMILEQGSGAVLCTGSPQIYEQAKEHLSLLQVRYRSEG